MNIKQLREYRTERKGFSLMPDNITLTEGGVTSPKGFMAAATAAGIKYQDRTDMAMIFSQVPCHVAGTFTTNVVKAAPVKWDQHIVYDIGKAQVVICNSGIANACTGQEGMDICERTAGAAARQRPDHPDLLPQRQAQQGSRAEAGGYGIHEPL